jgi:uncharacterized coiled-coil DUF342 family protein
MQPDRQTDRQTDRQRDRYDEANNRFSQFCERRLTINYYTETEQDFSDLATSVRTIEILNGNPWEAESIQELRDLLQAGFIALKHKTVSLSMHY